jgi:hypothetical protein
MPEMNAIVKYWRAQDRPELESFFIGWGEPFCFACGWLPPVEDGRPDSWARAASWLDRAHLHDRCNGGPDEPHNLVPLCHLCHDEMPAFGVYGHYATPADAKTAAWKWVVEHPMKDGFFQAWTDTFCRGRQPNRNTTLMRAKMRCLEELRQLEDSRQ